MKISWLSRSRIEIVLRQIKTHGITWKSQRVSRVLAVINTVKPVYNDNAGRCSYVVVNKGLAVPWSRLEFQDINCRLSKVSIFWKWSRDQYGFFYCRDLQALRNNFRLNTKRQKNKIGLFQKPSQKDGNRKKLKGFLPSEKS